MIGRTQTVKDTRTTDLLRRLLGKDHDAWQEMLKEYSGLLLGISRRTFASYGFHASFQDQEDAVADVWRNLLEHERRLIRQCLDRGNFPQMLVVLTRNRTIDIMRRHKMTVALPADEELDVPADPAGNDWDGLPKEVGAEALNTLSARERTCIQLFFLHRKKYREIETLAGIPQNSVGPTLARALTKLRSFFAQTVPKE